MTVLEDVMRKLSPMSNKNGVDHENNYCFLKGY